MWRNRVPNVTRHLDVSMRFRDFLVLLLENLDLPDQWFFLTDFDRGDGILIDFETFRVLLPVISKWLGEISRLELSGPNVKLRSNLSWDVTSELVHSSPVFPILWWTILISRNLHKIFVLSTFFFFFDFVKIWKISFSRWFSHRGNKQYWILQHA